MKGFVFLTTRPLSEEEILGRLDETEYVDNVYTVTGKYDFITELEVPSAEELLRVLDKISEYDFIIKSDMCICMHPIKEPTITHRKLTADEKGETLCKNIIAFIGVIVGRGKPENAMASFAEDGNVKRIYGTTGMYNALMEIYVGNLGELRTMINRMRTARMIAGTETFLVIDIAEMEEFAYDGSAGGSTSRRAISMINPPSWRK